LDLTLKKRASATRVEAFTSTPERAMSIAAANQSSGLPPHHSFNTTHWSVVLSAADTSAPGAQAALESLCGAYWYPLYTYVRQQCRSPEDAQDLTQEFFARFLERKYFQRADRQRGQFRSFLLTSLKHFLVNKWERATAQKRGGGKAAIPVDTVVAESLYGQELSHGLSADRIYERTWALSLLKRVRDRLADEYAVKGKGEHFMHLERFLPGQKAEVTYAEAARGLGLAEGTLKSDVNRLKKRYRDVLRAEIAQTVSGPDEINDELRHLIAVVSAG
jgi:DNA-directed RNA polymerase specialized sigma24 family protein